MYSILGVDSTNILTYVYDFIYLFFYCCAITFVPVSSHYSPLPRGGGGGGGGGGGPGVGQWPAFPSPDSLPGAAQVWRLGTLPHPEGVSPAGAGGGVAASSLLGAETPVSDPRTPEAAPPQRPETQECLEGKSQNKGVPATKHHRLSGPFRLPLRA